MSDTDKLHAYAASDREQAEAIRYLAAVGDPDSHAALSKGQAEVLDATADGWDAISAAVDAAGQ